MLDAVRSFFDDFLQVDNPAEASNEEALNLATAALLVEVMHADKEIGNEERSIVLELLKRNFNLSDNALGDLLQLAEEEARGATDLYQFTRLVNEHFDEAGRVALIRNMWRVAWADGNIHHYEEHLIRRVADLLHLHHSHFIRTKLETRDELT